MGPDHTRRVVPELSHLEGVAVRVIPFNDVATDAASQLDRRFHHWRSLPLLTPAARSADPLNIIHGRPSEFVSYLLGSITSFLKCLCEL